MFDEMSDRVSYVSYYSTLVQYAKSAGLNFTMGNPGADVPSSYLGIFDNIVIYEDSGLPSLSYLGGWHASYPKAGFSFVAIGVSSLDTAFVKSASSYVGYVYITDDVLPNPYDTVPAYFPELMAALDPGNQSNAVTPPTDVQPTNVTIPTPTVSTNGNVSAVDSPGAAVAAGNGSLTDTPSAANQKGNLQADGSGPDVWPVVAGVVVSAVFLFLIPRSLDAASAARGLGSSSDRTRAAGLWSRSDLRRRSRTMWSVNNAAKGSSG
jgi:hypothetical protein